MISLKREDNTGAIVEHELDDPENEKISETTAVEADDPGNEEISETTGHELDDPGNEEISETTGHELDDPGNEEITETTGHELDDPGNEEITETTGHERDDPGDEKSAEVAGDEPDDPRIEQSEKVTGDDLDAPAIPKSKSFAGNELNRSKYRQGKTYVEKKIKFKGIKKKFRAKITLFLFFVAGICLLVGGSYYIFQHKNLEKISSQSNIFPIPHDKSIIFESFILPIQNKQGYTYISLNLLLELSNIELKGEIVEKKEQLRGIIYDILEQEIHRVEDADALEKLKTLIIKRANTVLTSGEVREAFITNFMLV
jgi:flagellar basal body-associated protein FliL